MLFSLAISVIVFSFSNNPSTSRLLNSAEYVVLFLLILILLFGVMLSQVGIRMLILLFRFHGVLYLIAQHSRWANKSDQGGLVECFY